MSRRVVVRDTTGFYGIYGLIETKNEPAPSFEDGGIRYKLTTTTNRYILYAPDVVEVEPVVESEASMPDAWKPFVEHGVVASWPAPL